ncbi:MAG: hypothetical protein AAFO07_01695 [Bacteroidota bacterium]
MYKAFLPFIFFLIICCSNESKIVMDEEEIIERNKATILELLNELEIPIDENSFKVDSTKELRLITEKDKDSIRNLLISVVATWEEERASVDSFQEANKKRNEEWETMRQKLSQVSTKRDTYLIYLEYPHLMRLSMYDSADLERLGIHPRLNRK